MIGAGVAYRYFFHAFPEAAVNFKVTRAAALDQARAFAAAQGAPLDGYQSTVVFNVDDDQKTYLEREVGLDAGEPADVFRSERVVLGCAIFPAAAERRVSTCA